MTQLIAGTRQRADMENTQFVTDAELIGYLDNAYRRLYTMIVDSFDNWYVAPLFPIPLIAGQSEYDLPTDMFKLLGVDLASGSRKYTLQPWSLAERNRLNTTGWVEKPFRYILVGSKIRVLPTPDATSESLEIIYVPSPAELTANSTVEVWNGWDEYIMIEAAILCKQKEESDPTVLVMQREKVEKMIQDTMRVRDAGFPQKMTDVSRINDAYWPWRMP
jgi:hypothetical protein